MPQFQVLWAMASFARLPPPPRDFAARSTAQLSKGTVSEAPSNGTSEAPSNEASGESGGGPGGGGGGRRGGGGGASASSASGPMPLPHRTRGIRDRGAAGRLIYTLVRRLGECAGKLKGQV